MSVKLLSNIFSANLDPTSKLLLVKLYDSSNEKGMCWLSYRKISLYLNLQVRQVINVMMKLVRLGWVRREERFLESGRQVSNVFYLNLSKIRQTKRIKFDHPRRFDHKTITNKVVVDLNTYREETHIKDDLPTEKVDKNEKVYMEVNGRGAVHCIPISLSSKYYYYYNNLARALVDQNSNNSRFDKPDYLVKNAESHYWESKERKGNPTIRIRSYTEDDKTLKYKYEQQEKTLLDKILALYPHLIDCENIAEITQFLLKSKLIDSPSVICSLSVQIEALGKKKRKDDNRGA